jgi:hypothetical protein
MMNAIKYLTGILLIVLFYSCNDEWKEHYNTKVATVNENVWDAIQKDTTLSKYVNLVKIYHYDTLFTKENSVYTLFIPTNEALAQYYDSAELTRSILNYNITEFYINSESVDGAKKVQTLEGKFAYLFHAFGQMTMDNIPLIFESPLYLNGKYFKMNSIVYPKLNLYEYFAVNNKLLKEYIDEFDTIILDKSKSRPIGYDDAGRTIYDTVAIIANLFESEFFPVKHESRYKTATFVFPKVADYNNGLDSMAKRLGGNYHDYHDIPLSWQKNILIPYLLEHGVFENMLEPTDFLPKPYRHDTVILKNILGDSVVLKYKPGEKALCSNGYAYNYDNFKVPDTLWASTIRFQLEDVVRENGLNKWTWKEGLAKATSTTLFNPVKFVNNSYPKDTTVNVNFTSTYTGKYTLEFNVNNLFPRRFLMVIRTTRQLGGKYNIYVNDVLVRYIDYKDFNLTGMTQYVSPVSGIIYKFEVGSTMVKFDCLVDNLTEYGKAKIKIDYVGPSPSSGSGAVRFRGLSIDYIDFKPY